MARVLISMHADRMSWHVTLFMFMYIFIYRHTVRPRLYYITIFVKKILCHDCTNYNSYIILGFRYGNHLNK